MGFQVLCAFYVFLAIFMFYEIFQKNNCEITAADSYQLTEQELIIERKVRRNWLVSFLLFSVYSSFLISCLENVFLFFIYFLSPWFWVTYYCAFKKRGTAWLGWVMATSPCSILWSLLKRDLGNPEQWNAFFWIFMLFDCASVLYYLFNCRCLYRINYKRKQVESNRLFKDCEECSIYVSKMESTQNINDLNCIFGSAVRKWPGWLSQLSKAYNSRKALLIEKNST